MSKDRARFWQAIMPGLISAVLGLLVLLSPWGDLLERNVGLPWLFKLRGAIPAPPEIVVVSADQASAIQLEQESRLRQWDRSLHADLVRELSDLGASAIAFDIFFEGQGRPAEDKDLADAIAASNRVILVQQVERERVGQLNVEKLLYPALELSSRARGLAPFPLPKVRNRFGQFWTFYPNAGYPATLPMVALQVMVLTRFGYIPLTTLLERANCNCVQSLPESVSNSGDLRALMAALRNALAGTSLSLADSLNREITLLTTDPLTRRALAALFKAYQGPDSYHLNFYGPAQTVRTVSYAQILQSAKSGQPAEILELKGKVVFVGGSTRGRIGEKDGFLTVFSSAGGLDIAGVELAATALGNLLDNDTLRQVHGVGKLIAILLFGCISGFFAYRCVGTSAAPLVALIAAGYLGLAFLLFVVHNLWVPLAIPLAIQFPLSLLCAYLLHYRYAQKSSDKYSELIRYYVPERIAQEFDEGHDPTTDPEIVDAVCMSTDIASYTSLAERISASALTSLTNEYFQLLGDCVSRQGGEMLEARGDSMNAVWTAQGTKKNIGLSACLAALDILKTVAAYNEEWPDHPLPTRIGIHCGTVALGNVGGAGHLAYSILGDSINTASRIQNLNKKLDTLLLVSESVVNQLDDWLVRQICNFKPAGKIEVIPVFQIFGPINTVSSEQYHLCRLFSSAMSDMEAGNWDRAAFTFRDIIETHGPDGPSQFFLSRCQTYRHTQPQPGTQTLICPKVDHLS